jgi:hypothetical protein
VRVVEELQDFDLSSHLLIHVELADARPIQDLDRHLVAGQLVLS